MPGSSYSLDYDCFPPTSSTSTSLIIAQGILVAVMSAVLGSRDPDQVNSMAKQAGEVKHLYCFHNTQNNTKQQDLGVNFEAK